MASVRVRGRLNGELVSAEWQDGEVSGSEEALRAARTLAEFDDELVGASPTGPFYAPGLGEPLQFAATLSAVFDNLVEVSLEGVPWPTPGSYVDT
jgi:hypothetical protein